MSGFKLLAIRPLEGCDPKFRKNLKEGVVYKFYQDYRFLDKHGKEIKTHNANLSEPIVTIDPPKEEIDLYSQDNLKINVSAVVGKNGSGKSSLIELFYLLIFKISEKEMLEMDFSKEKERLSNEANREKYAKVIEQIERLGKFECEIFYEYGSKYYCSGINGDKIIHKEFESDETKTFDFSKFFYSIAINYSLYGLNDKYDLWLTPLFHKNDGYKTPLVINPMRTDGNIEVNKELHLGQSRTILTLSNIENDLPEIVNAKCVEKVKFIMDVSENNNIRNSKGIEHSVKYVFEQHQKLHAESPFIMFNRISELISGVIFSDDEIDLLQKEYEQENQIDIVKRYVYPIKDSEKPTIQKIKYELVKYVIRKLFKICAQYPKEYGVFLESIGDNDDAVKEPIRIKDIDGLITKLGTDKSHITLKLRQAIRSINANYFDNDHWQIIPYYNDNNKYSYELVVEWKDLRAAIKNCNNDTILDKLEIIPSAFVKPEFVMVNNYEFQSLSSGEQQLSNVVQTIIYHLYNLQSIHSSNDADRKPYNYVNIIFDEIELYFHPEFQRLFLKELLKAIKKLKFEGAIEKRITAINIIFATHSPFILSDIPSSNILRLENGIPLKEDFNQTFSANIHDMFLSTFFISSTIGAIAEEKIKEVISFHKRVMSATNKDQITTLRNRYLEEEKDRFNLFISLIGDDVIHGILENNLIQLEEKLGVGNFIEAKIKALTEEIKKLSNQTNNATD